MSKRIIDLGGNDKIKMNFYGTPIHSMTLVPVTPIIAEIGEEIIFRVVEITSTVVEK